MAKIPCCSRDEDPAKVARANKANSIAYQPALEKIAGFDINWNIVAYPTASWAKRVFFGEEDDVAVGRLAEAIFAASRVDNDDPLAAWTAHNSALSRRTEWLNTRKFRALHYSGPGTDLTIGLADGHDWQGGAATAKNGIICNPNIPTEEVFTTPHARRVEGRVVSTKPLSYQGSLIDGIAVRFEAGRIVEAKAARGEAVLKKVLDADEGARRLGEVALVPNSSPIAQSGLLFFNTLFDENAACHIAIGQCYAKCFVDGDKLSPEEIAAQGRQQEHDPYRLDDRLGPDRHRRPRRRRRPHAGLPQGRVGLNGVASPLHAPSIREGSACLHRLTIFGATISCRKPECYLQCRHATKRIRRRPRSARCLAGTRPAGDQPNCAVRLGSSIFSFPLHPPVSL